MATAPATGETRASRALPAILWAGLLAGCLDISAAFLNAGRRGVSPTRVLQGIAGGLLGRDSFTGGWPTAALGLAIHFLIATTAATVFYVASRKMAFLVQKAILAGALYGIAVYTFMYWVVMPLSRIRRGPFSWQATILAVIIHIVCVGLPIALVVRRCSK